MREVGREGGRERTKDKTKKVPNYVKKLERENIGIP